LLARDHELNEASQRMGVTYGTAQSYLKAVFDKTGVHSQAQLASRLLGAAH
jgi:DNA-binding CsgD family transcriptional regulator